MESMTSAAKGAFVPTDDVAQGPGAGIGAPAEVHGELDGRGGHVADLGGDGRKGVGHRGSEHCVGGPFVLGADPGDALHDAGRLALEPAGQGRGAVVVAVQDRKGAGRDERTDVFAVVRLRYVGRRDRRMLLRAGGVPVVRADDRMRHVLAVLGQQCVVRRHAASRSDLADRHLGGAGGGRAELWPGRRWLVPGGWFR